jgi:hypothetical protein
VNTPNSLVAMHVAGQTNGEICRAGPIDKGICEAIVISTSESLIMFGASMVGTREPASANRHTSGDGGQTGSVGFLSLIFTGKSL